MRYAVIGLALLTMGLFTGCANFQAQQAEQEEICLANDARYECRIAQAYAVHGALTKLITNHVKNGVMHPNRARKVLGDKDVCKSIVDVVDNPGDCSNLAGTWWMIEEANVLGATAEGRINLNNANTWLTTFQRILLQTNSGGI